MEFGPQLLENSLRASLPDEMNVITVQDSDAATYGGRGTAFDRGAPSLALADAEWEGVVQGLIAHAAMIVSECLLLGPGVRAELEFAYQLGKWDRTVLVLPAGQYSPVDSDPLVQMFPRCVWADSFHTSRLIDQPAVTDLVQRMRLLLELPEDVRRGLTTRGRLDSAYPIDLKPLARHYQTQVLISLAFQDQDAEMRYRTFWQLFRANAIHGIAWTQGDRSLETRNEMADNFLLMSQAMTAELREEGELVVVEGDLGFAEQCAVSALSLLAEDPEVVRRPAEIQLERIARLRAAIRAAPQRFLVRPRYGPFVVRRVDDSSA
jgi:hypothetical protein